MVPVIDAGVCLSNKSSHHRCIVDVTEDFLLEDARSMLPLRCACGYLFEKENSSVSVWLSHHKHMYTNPRTGKSGVNVHDVATSGAMWYCPWLVEDTEKESRSSSMLSDNYLLNVGNKRAPICVRLPNGSDWVVDAKASNAIDGSSGWSVTGDPPNLTATPSIDAGSYHSWLTDGILGADPNCVEVT